MAKKKAKRAGRPPIPEVERLGKGRTIRWRLDQYELIEQAAAASSIGFADFVRDAALDRARRTLGVAE